MRSIWPQIAFRWVASVMPWALVNRSFTTGSLSIPMLVLPAGTMDGPLTSWLRKPYPSGQSAPQPPMAIPMLCELMYFGTPAKLVKYVALG